MARLPGGRPNAPYQCTDQMQCWPLAGAWSGLLRPLSGPSGAGHVVRRIHRHFPFLRRGNRPSSCDGRKAERGRCWSPGFGRRGPRPAPVRLTSTRAPMALDRLCRQCRQSFSADHQLINRAVASKAALLPSKPPIAGLTALRIQAVPRKMLSSSIAALSVS